MRQNYTKQTLNWSSPDTILRVMEEVWQEMKKGEANHVPNEVTCHLLLHFFLKIAEKQSLFAEKNGKS